MKRKFIKQFNNSANINKASYQLSPQVIDTTTTKRAISYHPKSLIQQQQNELSAITPSH